MSECEPKFRNRILYLPDEVIRDVDAMIVEGWRSGHIWSVLNGKWKEKVPDTPSRMTVEKYVRWKQDQLESNKESDEKEAEIEAQILSGDVKEFEEGLTQVSSDKIPIADKRRILELLVSKSMTRIKALERWQKTNLTPALENCIIRYFSEVRNLVEILAKLNNEMAPDQAVIINIIDSKIQPLVQAFYRVIQQISPDKIELAKALLKDELKRLMSSDSTSMPLTQIEKKSNEENNTGPV